MFLISFCSGFRYVIYGYTGHCQLPIFLKKTTTKRNNEKGCYTYVYVTKLVWSMLSDQPHVPGYSGACSGFMSSGPRLVHHLFKYYHPSNHAVPPFLEVHLILTLVTCWLLQLPIPSPIDPIDIENRSGSLPKWPFFAIACEKPNWKYP